MFRAKVRELEGNPEAKELEARAFGLMRQGLTSTMDYRQQPKLSVYADQIVWGRSPVRIDIAGDGRIPHLQPDGGRKCGESGH